MIYNGKDTASAKILIVDDVEINRIVLEEIIKNMGCEPLLAENGQQALELAQQSLPKLILSDISMPGMDGFELCKSLKANSKTKEIPIIFISAFDEAEDIVKGLKLGGEDYITKPFITEVVQARVAVHLHLYAVKHELMETNRKLQISVDAQLRQMEEEKKNILYALANIAANNSGLEKSHIQRLRRNCRILAQGMQLSPRFEDQISDAYIDTIELAACLCDIGNIGIPKDLLRKESGFTQEETEILHSHADLGARLLKDLYVNSDYNDFLSISIDISHYHHENWDGSGYPEGLKGDQIPVAAQIVSIMETYCVLTGEKKYGREEALEMMEQEAGIKFNPDIYKICCRISRQFC
ncbi:MAG: response regulator [Eubacterium sp.]|nr:response regulator [Eubacterium sp.]